MAALKLSGLFLPALVSRYHEAEHREGKPLMECLFRSLLTAIIALFGGLLFFNSSTDSEPAPVVEVAPAILPTEAAQIHWEYEGEAGPENWGALSEDFALCSEGLEQSPIDITAADAENLTDLIFNYQPSTLEIVNNGHTIQANVTPGSFLSTNTDRYELRQFHFHHPSEHTINGDPAAMELHFVHVNQEGEIAVIGVLLAIGEENRAYMPILNSMPTAAGETMLVEASFSMESLMPQSRLYYAYSGSLTTPPCTEGVTWLLLTTPVEISAEQVEQFADIFELNARPVQDLNDREVQEDTE